MDKNRKLISYGLIIFLIFLIVYLIYLVFFIKKPAEIKLPEQISVPTFILSPTLPQSSGTEKISASGISVDNFYGNAYEVMPNNDVIIRQNTDFQFVYFAKGDYFLLSINNSPFDDVRKKSEQELIKILNINQEEACKLKIRIYTPYRVNPDFAYKDYPLSFCQ